jgi:D-alanyl-lipoteichoic acid acyltransferase DltB (MBOAT superfamily)
MFFNSITFLVFFGAVFLLFWLIPKNQRRTRNLFILITSYVFYGWWDWRFLSLIALSSAVDFALGRAIHKETDEKRRKGLLGVSLAVNLGLLGVFKYFNFVSHR